MFQPARTALFLGLLALAIFFASIPALPVSAQTISISVHRDGTTASDLILGDNLWVSFSGSQQSTLHKLSLKDESGITITSRTIASDSQGNISPTLLWGVSGVVGCDTGAVPDPLSYRFRTFEDAEALNGRTFNIILTLPTSSTPVATMALPLVAQTNQPRFYYADGSGCPRFSASVAETIWIVGIHLPSGSPDIWTHWAMTTQATSPLVDFRPQYPNGLVLAITGNQGTHMEPAIPGVPDDIDECVFGVVTERDPTHPTDPTDPTHFADPNRSKSRFGFGPPRTPTTSNTFHLPPFLTKPWCDPRWPCPPCEENP